ncbi:MAG: cytidine deaminase [Bdellovibrionia bacterium]
MKRSFHPDRLATQAPSSPSRRRTKKQTSTRNPTPGPSQMKPIGSRAMPSSVKKLYEVALEYRSRSYSPYSQCKVGSALKTHRGKIYGGCNVENASFGATICAERSAVLKAVGNEGAIQIREILVVTDASPPWSPCGLCRQVLSEFSHDLVVHLTNTKGHFESVAFSDLFPRSFNHQQIKKPTS